MDVGLGGHRIGDVELATCDGGVSRPLKLNLDPLGNSLGSLLAGLRRLRVELHLQSGGSTGQRLGADLRRGRRQDLVGLGGVFRAEATRVRGDNRPALGIDQTGRHALQRPWQAGREIGGRVDPRPASSPLMSSSEASSTPGNSPARQRTRTPRAFAVSNSSAGGGRTRRWSASAGIGCGSPVAARLGARRSAGCRSVATGRRTPAQSARPAPGWAAARPQRRPGRTAGRAHRRPDLPARIPRPGSPDRCR